MFSVYPPALTYSLLPSYDFQDLVLLKNVLTSIRFLQMYIIYMKLKQAHHCLTQIVNIYQETTCREVCRSIIKISTPLNIKNGNVWLCSSKSPWPLSPSWALLVDHFFSQHNARSFWPSQTRSLRTDSAPWFVLGGREGEREEERGRFLSNTT